MDEQLPDTAIRGFTSDSIWTSFERDHKVMVGASQEEWLAAVDLLCTGCNGWTALTPAQGRNLFAFFWHMPEWLRPEAWGKLVMAGGFEMVGGKKDRAKWAQSIHPFIVNQLVTGTFGVPVGGQEGTPRMSDKLRERLAIAKNVQLTRLPHGEPQ